MSLIVAFTGHRPQKLGGFGESLLQMWVRVKLREALVDLQPTEAISGMALGVDQWAAEICVELGIPFIAAVPCDGQEQTWPPPSQRRYHDLLKKAAHVEIVCPGPYESWKMQRRNEWMVDNADVVIAVWDGSSGGTANCARYAQKQKKIIRRIDPKDYR